MKGLLIKDFKLLKTQKSTLLLVIVATIIMSIFMENSTFIIAYLTFIGSFFVLSTISYDQFDNGDAFIFSLPIKRSTYVVEKYLFGLMSAGALWLSGVIISLIMNFIRDENMLNDILLYGFVILLILMIFVSFLLPFRLKFSEDKSRIVMFAVFGILFAVGFLLSKLAELFNLDIDYLLNSLATVSSIIILSIGLIIGIALILISGRISIGIMNKKEF